MVEELPKYAGETLRERVRVETAKSPGIKLIIL